jgi:hypothetical protein
MSTWIVTALPEITMRTIFVASLTLLASSPGLAQDSLCNPCVDPPNPALQRDLLNIESSPVRAPDDVFDIGAAQAELRSLDFSDGRRALVDEALLSAARPLLPREMTDAELSAALRDGLWRQDLHAVAVSRPEGMGYRTYVFVRQGDGSYAATNASSTVANAAFGYFGWPATEYERYETEPVDWRITDNGHSLLYVRVRAWRQGQRYTVIGHYLVGPDGSFTNP